MPAMLGVHAIIGLGEALVTVAALAFITQVRPDLLGAAAVKSRGGFGWVVGGLAIALVVVLFSPWASADPDGLKRVAENLGFIGQGADAPYQILPDYTIPFLGETGPSTIIAGIIGALVVAVLVIGVGWLLRRGGAPPSEQSPAPGSR
jgi:cobalt/nickel transport system permease protein